MNKPGSLRKALGDAIPDLRRNPDRLLVFVDEGTIAAVNTKSLSFEYRYQLNLILTDFDGSAEEVMVALLAWVSINQSNLLDNPDRRSDGITFEADHLNHKTYDLSIKLRLAEEVKVTIDETGKRHISFPPEKVPEWRQTGLYAE